jgi:hypothetical protein
MAYKRPPRRRIADVEPSDAWLVPVDYVAAVYGIEAAEGYIADLEVEDDEERAALLERSRRIGRIGLSGEPSAA